VKAGQIFEAITKPVSKRATALHEVDDEYDQRYHQQQVNQASAYVQGESGQPQNQAYGDNSPKHNVLLFLRVI
jgi:hypothetical protein